MTPMLRFATVFFLLAFAGLASVTAAFGAMELRETVTINRYCKSPHVFLQIMAADRAGRHKLAHMIRARALQSGQCVEDEAVEFSPKAILKGKIQGPVEQYIIFKGRVADVEDDAFTLVPVKYLELFLVERQEV